MTKSISDGQKNIYFYSISQQSPCTEKIAAHLAFQINLYI